MTEKIVLDSTKGNKLSKNVVRISERNVSKRPKKMVNNRRRRSTLRPNSISSKLQFLKLTNQSFSKNSNNSSQRQTGNSFQGAFPHIRKGSKESSIMSKKRNRNQSMRSSKTSDITRTTLQNRRRSQSKSYSKKNPSKDLHLDPLLKKTFLLRSLVRKADPAKLKRLYITR